MTIAIINLLLRLLLLLFGNILIENMSSNHFNENIKPLECSFEIRTNKPIENHLN